MGGIDRRVYGTSPWTLQHQCQVNTRMFVFVLYPHFLKDIDHRVYRGWATWCPDTQTLAVTNLTDGVDLYSGLLPAQWRRTLTMDLFDNKRKMCAFLDQGRYLLVGGDNGVASIFDLEGNRCMEDLKHEEGKTYKINTPSFAAADNALWD